MPTKRNTLPRPEHRNDRIEAYAMGQVELADVSTDALTEMFQFVCLELLKLRVDHATLVGSLAKEVRTERLAVVHPDDGRELISTTVLPESVALHVKWLSEDDPLYAEIGLTAGTATSDNQGDADIYVAAGEGEIVGMLSATTTVEGGIHVGGEGRLHLDAMRWDGHGSRIESHESTLDSKALEFR